MVKVPRDLPPGDYVLGFQYDSSDLPGTLAAVTIALEASEAEMAALETRISWLKRELRRLEAELADISRRKPSGQAS